MALNLTQHRSGSSVWEQRDVTSTVDHDAERWLITTLAATLLLIGWRRRTWAGLASVIGGSSLAWWATAGVTERRRARARLRYLLPEHLEPDVVESASEDSFPASDAPPFTAGIARVK